MPANPLFCPSIGQSHEWGPVELTKGNFGWIYKKTTCSKCSHVKTIYGDGSFLIHSPVGDVYWPDSAPTAKPAKSVTLNWSYEDDNLEDLSW